MCTEGWTEIPQDLKAISRDYLWGHLCPGDTSVPRKGQYSLGWPHRLALLIQVILKRKKQIWGMIRSTGIKDRCGVLWMVSGRDLSLQTRGLFQDQLPRAQEFNAKGVIISLVICREIEVISAQSLTVNCSSWIFRRISWSWLQSYEQCLSQWDPMPIRCTQGIRYSNIGQPKNYPKGTLGVGEMAQQVKLLA